MKNYRIDFVETRKVSRFVHSNDGISDLQIAELERVKSGLNLDRILTTLGLKKIMDDEYSTSFQMESIKDFGDTPISSSSTEDVGVSLNYTAQGVYRVALSSVELPTKILYCGKDEEVAMQVYKAAAETAKAAAFEGV